MTLTLFIDGAAGTTGLEIADRLAGRPEFTQIVLEEKRRKDISARRDALNSADIAILCLPDDAARDAVALVDPASRVRIIDASSAHRVAPGWTYGFPELVGRETVATARRISNPGCYPTGFLALLAPLTRSGANLLPPQWPYTVNAVSGYSGGGKALIARFERDPDLAYRAYGLQLDHKHRAEMRVLAGLEHEPLFSPAVVPAMRGMIVDVPIPRAAMSYCGSSHDIRSAWQSFYHDARLVSVACEEETELLLSRDAAPWDGMDLHVFASPGERHLRLIARLDNLGKGASGAVVQSLNLMAGLPETTGLRLASPA